VQLAPSHLNDLDSSLGQVWTPESIADLMADWLCPFLKSDSLILDPCSGPLTFYKAFVRRAVNFQEFHSIEIDNRHVQSDSKSISDSRLRQYEGDFFSTLESNIYDVVVMNPPYVRQELLSQDFKKRLQNDFPISKKSNLYAYFLLEAIRRLKVGGHLCAIVYDTLNHSAYGIEVSAYMASIGTLIRAEKMSAPFPGVAVDAEVLLWVKTSEEAYSSGNFKVAANSDDVDYARIDALASVRRGSSFQKRSLLVTSDRDYIRSTPILTRQNTQSLIAQPNAFSVFSALDAESDGALLNSLNSQIGSSEKVLISKLPRAISGQVLFNYFIRSRVRHILNLDQIAASDNFYCSTFGTKEEALLFWVVMNSSQVEQALISASRPQGSGLRKLQLYEYKAVKIPDYRKFSERCIQSLLKIGTLASAEEWPHEKLRFNSTQILKEGLNGHSGASKIR
jgi:adenine-specific DNA-methyltransferase